MHKEYTSNVEFVISRFDKVIDIYSDADFKISNDSKLALIYKDLDELSRQKDYYNGILLHIETCDDCSRDAKRTEGVQLIMSKITKLIELINELIEKYHKETNFGKRNKWQNIDLGNLVN